MSSIKVCPSSEIDGMFCRNFGPDLSSEGVDPDFDFIESNRDSTSDVLQKSPLQGLSFANPSGKVDFSYLPDGANEADEEDSIDEVDELSNDCKNFLASERSFIGKFRNMAKALLLI